MGKDKKLPGTKTQPKYFGPYKVEKVTKGHVATDHMKKSKKVPNQKVFAVVQIHKKLDKISQISFGPYKVEKVTKRPCDSNSGINMKTIEKGPIPL